MISWRSGSACSRHLFSSNFYKEITFNRRAAAPVSQIIARVLHQSSFIVFEVSSFTVIYLQTSLMLG
jgi:hypothetical protein